MKLEYLSTLDETIDTQILWLRDVNTILKWRLWGIFYWLTTSILVYIFSSGSTHNKIVVGFILGGFIGGNLVFNAESALRKKMRKLIIKKAGTFEPALAEVTLNDNKINFSLRDTTAKFDLSKLLNVEVENDGLILNFQEGKLLYLPSNAFRDSEERDKWLSKIKSI